MVRKIRLKNEVVRKGNKYPHGLLKAIERNETEFIVGVCEGRYGSSGREGFIKPKFYLQMPSCFCIYSDEVSMKMRIPAIQPTFKAC
jgi:hypothetical protein